MYQQQDANIVTFPTAQPEGKKGFVMITNELLEASCKVKLSSRQHNILNAVIRKTIGFNRDFDWLAPQQIAELIDYDGDISHIYADLRVLKARKILVADGKSIGVNLNTSEWELKKPVAKTSRKAPQNKQKTASNLGNSLAENSQHTSEKPLKKVAENCHLQNTIIHTTNNITPCSPPAGEASPKTKRIKSNHSIFSKKPPAPTTRKNPDQPMTMDWQPDWTILAANLRMLGIPLEFAHEVLPEFRTYWIEEGVTRRWQSSFLSRVQSQWVRRQTHQGVFSSQKQTESNRVTNDNWHENVFDEFGELSAGCH
ncbi:replication protein [Endozoicomonas sp. SM1973]|uniref:Replication protein n=1 Tax=Spartinivicinus marinus TaxID=2994442 RepID=A0A853I7R1_9GAMM|nr:replication protein [Spartinivicinus marinus]NYZ69353.1 replication protein [Spartinivicinus marinus]